MLKSLGSMRLDPKQGLLIEESRRALGLGGIGNACQRTGNFRKTLRARGA